MSTTTSQDSLRKTPLHRCHLQLGAKLVPFAGYEMPVQYTSVLEEARTVRLKCGLFDVSHMGQFSVRGKDTLGAVQRVVTNDLSKLGLGQAQYNMLCNDAGGVIDDLVVYRRSDQETFICVNASNRKEDFKWMQSRLGPSVTLEDQSDETALLALQGPTAEAVLASGVDAALIKQLRYYWAVDTTVFGIPCYLSRTGYTGEDGFEIYLARDKAIQLWETLVEIGRKSGLVPAGLGARDTLRLEMGYPLHGHELSPTINPLSAGLGWVVKLNQPTHFVGWDAIKKEAEKGSARLLRGFIVQDRRIARQGYAIADENHAQIGEITSGTFSPHLNAPIALGFVNRAASDLAQVWVQVRESYVPATVVKLPFVPSHTKKNP